MKKTTLTLIGLCLLQIACSDTNEPYVTFGIEQKEKEHIIQINPANLSTLHSQIVLSDQVKLELNEYDEKNVKIDFSNETPSLILGKYSPNHTWGTIYLYEENEIVVATKLWESIEYDVHIFKNGKWENPDIMDQAYDYALNNFETFSMDLLLNVNIRYATENHPDCMPIYLTMHTDELKQSAPASAHLCYNLKTEEIQNLLSL